MWLEWPVGGGWPAKSASFTGLVPTRTWIFWHVFEYLSTSGGIWPYLAIVFFLVLTGSGLPIPEEVPIVAAGVLAAKGHLDPWWALAACVVGALLGDLLVYSGGRLLGRNFFRKHKWFALLLHEDREKQMEDLIRRHGWKVFFAARFMIGVRAPVYMAAGVMRVPLLRFLLMDGIAATVVVAIVFGLSYHYGPTIGRLVHEFTIGATILGIAAVLAAIAFFWWHRRRRQPPSVAAAPAHANNAPGGDRPDAPSPADDTRRARISA